MSVKVQMFLCTPLRHTVCGVEVWIARPRKPARYALFMRLHRAKSLLGRSLWGKKKVLSFPEIELRLLGVLFSSLVTLRTSQSGSKYSLLIILCIEIVCNKEVYFVTDGKLC
jgi:hypothetical protein